MGSIRHSQCHCVAVPDDTDSEFHCFTSAGHVIYRVLGNLSVVSTCASTSSETVPDERVSFRGDEQRLTTVCREVDSDAELDALLDMPTVRPSASSHEHVSATSMYCNSTIKARRLVCAQNKTPLPPPPPPPPPHLCASIVLVLELHHRTDCKAD